MADPNDVISKDLRTAAEIAELATLGSLEAGRDAGSGWRGPETIEDYWTAERMANARPVTLGEPAAGGAQSSAGGSAGAPETEAAVSAAAGFQTERVSDTAQMPYAAVGKLFMTFGSGDDSWATAWLAAPRVIVTAGHCLYDHRRGGMWADKIVFVLRYAGGSTGKLAATGCHVLAGWHGAGADMYSYDVAAATLRNPVAGVVPLRWVQDLRRQDEPIESVGYPYQWVSPVHDFDGEAMWRCRGSHAGGEPLVSMANNMTEGCSGGPWVIRRGGVVQVGGINSYRPAGGTGLVQSPRLGRGLANLISAAA